MKKRLAIVIPAYKQKFLRAALDSVALQTNKDFTLYIGNDSSPDDLYSIIKPYQGKIEIVYKRFESNLGGKDLVAQWERCIDMTQGEEWLWLFSDDDVMDSHCVQLFYDELQKRNSFDLYHFNVKVIDDDDKITRIPKPYPEILSAYDYYKGKLSGRYLSLVVENIFSRRAYEKYGRFQNFDLAWGSDTATWIKFCKEKGMKTITDGFIYWRSGLENISPDMSSPIVKRKVNALVNFFSWSFSYFPKSKRVLLINIRAFVSRMSKFKPYIHTADTRKAIKDFCVSHQCRHLQFPILLLIRYKR